MKDFDQLTIGEIRALTPEQVREYAQKEGDHIYAAVDRIEQMWKDIS